MLNKAHRRQLKVRAKRKHELRMKQSGNYGGRDKGTFDIPGYIKRLVGA